MSEQHDNNIAGVAVDGEILSRLSPNRIEAMSREASELSAAVSRTPLPPHADPSSFLSAMTFYASKVGQ